MRTMGKLFEGFELAPGEPPNVHYGLLRQLLADIIISELTRLRGPGLQFLIYVPGFDSSLPADRQEERRQITTALCQAVRHYEKSDARFVVIENADAFTMAQFLAKQDADTKQNKLQ